MIRTRKRRVEKENIVKRRGKKPLDGNIVLSFFIIRCFD